MYQEAYADRLKLLLRSGQGITAHGRGCTELVNYTAEITREALPFQLLVTHPTRKLGVRYAIGEACYFFTGVHDGSLFTLSKKAAELFDDTSEYGARLRHGSSLERSPTGPRIDQLKHVVSTLMDDPHSRQAVVSIYQPCDAAWPSNMPCTLSLQYLIRDSALNCIVTMRSNDAWLGHVLDMFNFRLWQSLLSKALRRPMGWLFLNAGSFHLYDSNTTAAEQLVASPAERDPKREQLVSEFMAKYHEYVDQSMRTNDPRYRLEFITERLLDFYWREVLE